MGAKSKKKVKDIKELTKNYEAFIEVKGEKEITKEDMEKALKKASKKPATGREK